MTTATDKVILGVDPGTTVMGYGIIHVKGKQVEMINFGVIQLQKLPTHPDKLKRIYDRMDGLIKEFKPDEMAIEAPFFGKNVQSMLKLGRAQGVAIATALANNLPFEEYSPRRIKQSITGSGAHQKSKSQECYKRCSSSKKCPNIWMLRMDWRLPYVIIIPKELENTTKRSHPVGAPL